MNISNTSLSVLKAVYKVTCKLISSMQKKTYITVKKFVSLLASGAGDTENNCIRNM